MAKISKEGSGKMNSNITREDAWKLLNEYNQGLSFKACADFGRRHEYFAKRAGIRSGHRFLGTSRPAP